MHPSQRLSYAMFRLMLYNKPRKRMPAFNTCVTQKLEKVKRSAHDCSDTDSAPQSQLVKLKESRLSVADYTGRKEAYASHTGDENAAYLSQPNIFSFSFQPGLWKWSSWCNGNIAIAVLSFNRAQSIIPCAHAVGDSSCRGFRIRSYSFFRQYVYFSPFLHLFRECFYPLLALFMNYQRFSKWKKFLLSKCEIVRN